LIAIIGVIAAVVVPYAIRHHQRNDERRAEAHRERTEALRAILVGITRSRRS
jgi:type II secretory pathway pseudopilin PulG